jgi:hypothetical protein
MLLVLAGGPVAGDPPEDGFYRPAPEGVAAPEGLRFLLEVEHASLVAQDNRNETFALHLRVPYDPALSAPGSLRLAVGGTVHVSSGAGSSGTTWSHVSFRIEGRAAADAVAAFLGVSPRLRRHPGHALSAEFVPAVRSLPAGPAPRVAFRLTNVGDAPVAFVQGGRNRAERDNQYDFLARLAERLVPDIGTQTHFGGRSVRRLLGPGETFEDEVDLAKWFRFDRPGLHEVLGTYALTLVDVSTDDQVPLWEEHVTAPFLVEVTGPATVEPVQVEGAVVGPWSEVVGGVRGRLVTALDDLDRGGAFVSVYVELESVHHYTSDVEIPADREVEVELLDEAMRPVPPRTGHVYSGPLVPPAPIRIQNHGRARWKVSAGGCGVAQGGVTLCFLHRSWFLPDADRRPYHVRGILRRDPKAPGGPGWAGRLDLPTTQVDRRRD